jgi:uncharacterized protein (DUF1697 family)
MHVALLRGVNIGSHGKVAMAELRALLEGLGFDNVRTLLNSGNVVFDGGRKSADALETLLESACAKQLGLRTDFFVRSAKEWQAAVAANPFKAEASDDPGHLLLLPCKSAPAAKNVTALQAAIRGNERVAVKGTHLYAVYPDGIGRSKLTTALIEKTLATRVTGRNWNTVLRLAELMKD